VVSDQQQLGAAEHTPPSLHQALVDLLNGRTVPSQVAGMVDQLVEAERRQAVAEVLAQLAHALDVALDVEQPHASFARATSIHASLEAARRGGRGGVDFLLSDLARMTAGWRQGR
jgi:hypothetical protein